MDDFTKRLLKRFSTRLTTLRKQHGFSQEEFAEVAGLDRAGYGRIERGKVDIRLSTASRIADALDISLAELLELRAKGGRSRAASR